MAIKAFHKMNVVAALGIPEGGIHFFHIQAAIRKAGMAFRTGGTCRLVVRVVAGQAAEALMDPHAGAIIPGSSLACPFRRMALVTHSLAFIRTHLHQTVSIQHPGNRQVNCGDREAVPPIEKCQ